MSEWHKIKLEDIELSDDSKEIEVYVKHDDFGAIYAEISIDVIKKFLKENGILK